MWIDIGTSGDGIGLGLFFEGGGMMEMNYIRMVGGDGCNFCPRADIYCIVPWPF